MELEKRCHILAIPFPAQGHINPMMQLCKWLAKRGFIITLANIDSIHENMQEHWSPQPGIDIRLASIPFEWRSISTGFDAYAMANLEAFFGHTLDPSFQNNLEDLIKNMGSSISLILSDYLLPVTQEIADKFGIDRVIFKTGSAAWACVEYHLPAMQEDGNLPPQRDVKLEGLQPLRVADLPWYLHVPEQGWIEMCTERPSSFTKATWVLVNSVYDLEADVFDFMQGAVGKNFLPIGPLLFYEKQEEGKHGMSLRPEDEGCLEWLDTQKPDSVIYISFGSIATLSLEQFQELAAGLEASTVPFLWVIRPQLISGASEEIYKSFCLRTADRGRVIPWAPQTKVLAHPAVGGFLSHCGWNSTIESICEGVPLLAWPWAAEQNLNCKIVCEDWGIGARFLDSPDEIVLREKVERLVKYLMGQDGLEMRARVKKLQQICSIAQASRTNLDSFVSAYSNVV